MRTNASEDAIDRTLRLAQHLFTGGAVTTLYIRERFGVSTATAKRYMVRLERVLPVTVKQVSTYQSDSYGNCRKEIRLVPVPANPASL